MIGERERRRNTGNGTNFRKVYPPVTIPVEICRTRLLKVSQGLHPGY